jgi:aldehyde oxidoreductase
MEEYIPGRTENLHDYLIPTIGDVPPIESDPDRGARPRRPVRRQGAGRARADPDRAGDPERDPPCDRRAASVRGVPATPTALRAIRDRARRRAANRRARRRQDPLRRLPGDVLHRPRPDRRLRPLRQ